VERLPAVIEGVFGPSKQAASRPPKITFDADENNNTASMPHRRMADLHTYGRRKRHAGIESAFENRRLGRDRP
jgi:hypothetical protein